MLSKITIKNVALIESAEISFHDGLNVLSGETGAGKSVLLESVNFVLGAKADRTMIRHGESECMVKAEFILPEDSLAVAVLREMDIDSDGEIIISRKFNDAGKSAIKINGNTVTASMLRSVTDALVDVHGQSEHFYLLSEQNQLKTLDDVVGTELLPLKEELQEKTTSLKEVIKQIEKLGGDEASRGRRLDLLRYEIDEIERVALQEGEEEALKAKRNKINHMEKILASLGEASAIFSGDGGLYDALYALKRSLRSIEKLDEEYAGLSERLENLQSEAEDIGQTVQDLHSNLYFDEGEAEEIESRLDAIQALQRKYGPNKEAVDAYLQTIREEFDLLSDCEGQFAKLNKQKEKLGENIYTICQAITRLRKEKGKDFCKRVSEELASLNIPHARCEILFEDYDPKDVFRATNSGLDVISFQFSANVGEPLKPLSKIISGGEMSRFMLAMKTQCASWNGISTYIFDEIDAGISGKTAKVVAEKFAQIATNTQIICVSHLAQISAMSDRSILIEKQETDGKTKTFIRVLDEAEKRAEVIRLLGGELQDDFAKLHAEELIKKANEYKEAL